ncbi:hypothetical protein C5167_039872 [Papaver somniferum]|uniref:Argonaute linker 2 domain-containing protein n=1 Tax=Papaver somniferum TaxID=3469 RepID=A0A4Y7IGT3_PAPSO|nr:hypothetical protein C5167_039872 [Papaver somniferum]
MVRTELSAKAKNKVHMELERKAMQGDASMALNSHFHWKITYRAGNKVCKIVEGQRYSKRLDERQITALLKVTCGRPRERVKDIMQNVRHNAYYEDPFAKKSGIKTSDKLAQVGARILPSPWDQFDTMYLSDNESYVMYSRPHF